MKYLPDLSKRVERPDSPIEEWSCEKTYMDVWVTAVETLLGRKLTGSMVPGEARWTGERAKAEFFYPTGLTAIGFVEVLNDVPMCIGEVLCGTRSSDSLDMPRNG